MATAERRDDHRRSGCRCACRSRPARARSASRSSKRRQRCRRRCCGRSSRRSTRWTPTGVPQLEAVTISGPFDGDRSRRHAEPPPDLQLPARRGQRARRRAGAAGGDTACATQILSTLARRAYRRPVTDADLQPLLAFYETGRQKGDASTPASSWRSERMLADPTVRVPRRARSRGHGARRGVTASAISSWRRACRSSSGAAFPTTSCSTSASRGQAARPGGARAAGAAHAAPTRARKRSSSNFAGQWLLPAQPPERRAQTRISSPTSTTTCGRRFSARPSCSSRASCATIAACSIC